MVAFWPRPRCSSIKQVISHISRAKKGRGSGTLPSTLKCRWTPKDLLLWFFLSLGYGSNVSSCVIYSLSINLLIFKNCQFCDWFYFPKQISSFKIHVLRVKQESHSLVFVLKLSSNPSWREILIFRKYTNWFQPAKCNESLTNNNQLGLKHYPHHHQNCLTDCSTFTFNILQTSNPSDPSDIPDQSDPSNQLNQSESESESEKTKTFRIARFLSQKLPG